MIWGVIFSPALGLWGLIQLADDETLPKIKELENPKTDLASVILSADFIHLGKYYHENRTNVQQLAKLLFPRKKLSKFEFALRKIKEWIIATKLERNYTKEEILAMYLNKFDFLNNAVGINSASQVYFNKSPSQLDLHESAMLIGMAKNPSLFNPVRRPDTVHKRRSVVLFQMYKNNYIEKEVYDSTKKLELGLDYNKVDHQTGLAPYFREVLRLELGKLLNEKNKPTRVETKKYKEKDQEIYHRFNIICSRWFV